MKEHGGIGLCLSEWYPILQGIPGVKTPLTRIIKTETDLTCLLDGKEPEGFPAFLTKLIGAVQDVGGTPCFLRTGHLSGKHEWDRTCFLSDTEALNQHVYKLVEESHLVDIYGLPTDVWVVRKLIPVREYFKAFRQMPITREVRVFFQDHKIQCHHPYWPESAFANDDALPHNWKVLLAECNDYFFEPVKPQVDAVAGAFDGYWSVDFLQANDGSWYAIDMAWGERSWHWPSCPFVNKEAST